MKKHLFLIGFLFVISLGCSQEKDIQPTSRDCFDIIRPVFTGDLAYETTDYVAQYWRVAGNTGFNESVFWISEHFHFLITFKTLTIFQKSLKAATPSCDIFLHFL